MLFRFLPQISVLLLLAGQSAAGQEPGEFSPEQIATFNDQILGILKTNCLKCHSGHEPKGGLILTSRAAILKGGESGPAVNLKDHAASLMVQAVRYDGYEMPPTGQLPPKQIDAIAQWVAAGLPWPKELAEIEVEPEKGPPQVNDANKQFWSFQPVRNPPVPETPGNSVHPIDAFINAGLQSHGLSQAPAADPRQLIRRAYYDLTGLPPSVEAVETFAADPSPAAWSAVIESLLASPHYGEQWGRHWLDLVRYAETNSYERDGAKPLVWRYRDYVIQSFNADKPYDQFVTEQIAGDEIAAPTPDSVIATGYYRLGRWDDEPVDPELAYYDDLDDILATTSQTFLGLTVNCARCHDHKIDPIPQRDYYRMLAFFQNIRRFGVRSHESVLEASVTEIDQPEDGPAFRAAQERYDNEVQANERTLARIEEKVKPDFKGVEHDEFQFEANRLSLIEKREDGVLTKAEVSKYRNATKQRDHLRNNRPTGMAQALCVKEDLVNPRPSHILERGNPQAKADIVTPGFPAILSPPEISVPPVGENARSSGRRLALAQWLTSPANPLPARVMANRIWQYHFGRGIVRSSSDFGFQGTAPTHPELLDWLATQFVEQKWSIKAMHRLIMTSAAYQMSSQPNESNLAKDAVNDHLWRFDMRRLTAEEIRDSILWANGTLNQDRMFGPSIYTDIPQEVKAGQSQPGSGWGESSAEDRARRSIYIHVKRSLLDPVLESFDFADTDQTCPVRFATTQPTQALSLLNSDFALSQADQFAAWLGTAASDESDESRVRLALTRVMQRQPTADEVLRGTTLITTLQTKDKLSADKALRYFCLVALNLNEFIYLD